MELIIPLKPVTKKNSQRIIKVGGYPRIIQSKAYCTYEKEAVRRLKGCTEKPITSAVNVAMIFYMPTLRKVDLVNLEEACLDVLVRAGILADDKSSIVATMDGSSVQYDKDRPRTVIRITKAVDRAEIGAELSEEEGR